MRQLRMGLIIILVFISSSVVFGGRFGAPGTVDTTDISYLLPGEDILIPQPVPLGVLIFKIRMLLLYIMRIIRFIFIIGTNQRLGIRM